MKIKFKVILALACLQVSIAQAALGNPQDDDRGAAKPAAYYEALHPHVLVSYAESDSANWKSLSKKDQDTVINVLKDSLKNRYHASNILKYLEHKGY